MDLLEDFVISWYGFIRRVWEYDGFIRGICGSAVMEILENFGTSCHGFIREVLTFLAVDLFQEFSYSCHGFIPA